MSAKYACMAAHAAVYPVRLMARVLGVSASGYYAAPRVHQALRQAGEGVSRKRVARLMRGAALVGTTPRRWRGPRTRAATAPAPNLLARAFAPSAALNTAWVADITYLPYRGGTAYLAVVLDLASRAVIGWALESHLLTTLPVAALRMALRTRRRRGPTLHHSDRGSQYVSAPYQQLLAAHALTPSLSASGTCYDNAVVESFFNTLKRECPVHQETSVRALRLIIGHYLTRWYNAHRLHSSLGYRSPQQYEAQLRRPA